MGIPKAEGTRENEDPARTRAEAGAVLEVDWTELGAAVGAFPTRAGAVRVRPSGGCHVA